MPSGRPPRSRSLLPDDCEISLPTPREVRCLGPGREHTFLSRDPARHRVCGRCTAAIAEMPTGAAEYRATEVGYR